MPGFVRNGAQLLLLVRDSAGSWEQLCARIGIDMTSPADMSNRVTLSRVLTELREAGLIEYDGKRPEGSAEIKVADQWNHIQSALGGPKLADIGDISASADGMAVNPAFGRPRRVAAPADLFALIPFKKDLIAVFEKVIKKVARRVRISARYAGDVFTTNEVMKDVWADICSARVIIADCTGRNPNVFYEIGLAHVVGKNVILTAQNEKDIPFDIQHRRRIIYKNTADGIPEYEQLLASTLQETLNLGPTKKRA